MNISTYTINHFDKSFIKPNNGISLNSKVSVRCAEPIIIVNPILRHNLTRLHYIHYPDTQIRYTYGYDWFRFRRSLGKNKSLCNYDNLNDFYSVTTDGEIINLYILVPCNKCFICKDKLSQMWQFRGIAESKYSNNKTYFVTLTYNDDFKPYRGVDVKAIQLFMKRLRNNLDKLNIQHNIKYFACGEYGKNTHRPHYHLILWHFPDDKFNNVTDVLHFIEHSWSVYDFETQEHISIGFAYCKACDTGSLKYVMKYTRKQCYVPDGQNPFFTSCSKFIGYDWFIDNFKYLKEHPQLLTLSISDPTKGDVYSSPYPTYYKTKLMPNFSQIFPKEIVKSLEFCLNLHRQLINLSAVSVDIKYTPNPILFKYYKLLYGYTNNEHCFTFDAIDDYLYLRACNYCPFEVHYQILKKQRQIAPYLILLEDYYNLNIGILNNAQRLKDQRKLLIDKRPQVTYTLDQLRIENEKLEYWRKKEEKREFF